MLIPPRRLSAWTTVPGTETTFADVVPVVVNCHIFEASAATLMMAYPGSLGSEPAPHGVRLDFRWVVHLAFTSLWGADEGGIGIEAATSVFALNVLDDSPLTSRFLAGYSDPLWPFDRVTPSEALRHFHISFDDFGRYDILAVDCIARSFPRSAAEPWSEGGDASIRAMEQARDEQKLLRDAMALDPPAPLPDDLD